MNLLYTVISAFLFNLLCAYLWLQFCILLHEVAHATVGKIVGFNSYKIQVGTGKPVLRFSAWGLQWVLGPKPWGGLTYHKPCVLPGLRWRGAVMVLAGPAADVLSLWLLVTYWPLTVEFDPYGLQKEDMPYMIRYLIVVQGYSLLYSLWPHDVKIAGQTLPNDAKYFIRYISGKYTEEMHQTLADIENYEQAMSRYAPGFKAEPSSWLRQMTPEEANLWLEAMSESENENHVVAIEKFETLLQNPKLHGPERAQVLDGMASMAVMQGSDIPPEKVVAWAREAHTLVPNARTVRGTLAGALVQSGDYTEAIEMLTPLTTPDNEQIDRVISSLYLAKAWDKQGDPSEAARWLSLASKLGGFDSLRDRIAAELSPEARGERA